MALAAVMSFVSIGCGGSVQRQAAARRPRQCHANAQPGTFIINVLPFNLAPC